MFKLLLLCLGLVVPSMGAQPFIIGGEKVESISDFPHHCSLTAAGTKVWGASIISENWLVTTASTLGLPIGNYKLHCGSLKGNAGTEIGISAVHIHEKFNQGEGAVPNDIAVIKVSSPMDLSGDNMKAIVMATTDQAGNNDCYMTGWGYINASADGQYKDNLMQAKVQVYTNTYCKSVWPPSTINDGHVCTGDKENGRGACYEDFGSPVVCDVDGTVQLVGVLTWLERTCDPSFPSGNTRISHYREWIRGKTGV